MRPRPGERSRHGSHALFRDRADAGRQLADRLGSRARERDAVVLGLARGGVPVAAAVAGLLELPLDVFVVRKLGVPGQEELAFGAIASGDVRVIRPGVVQTSRITAAAIERIAAREQRELERRERAYRGGRPLLAVAGRTALVVDDGIATGASMRAAIAALRKRDAGRVVVVVPVAPAESCAALAQSADEVVCPHTPNPFSSVGQWYEDFHQTTDEEVRALLAGAAAG